MNLELNLYLQKPWDLDRVHVIFLGYDPYRNRIHHCS